MPRRNPYRTVRRVAVKAGNIAAGLFFGFALVLVLWVFIAALWKDGWGAWALTLPLILIIGGVAAAGVLALIALPFSMFAQWWRKREREWGPDA